MRSVLGVVLLLVGLLPLTFRASAHALDDRAHRRRAGRSAPARRRKRVQRALDAAALAIAVVGVLVLAGVRL